MCLVKERVLTVLRQMAQQLDFALAGMRRGVDGDRHAEPCALRRPCAQRVVDTAHERRADRHVQRRERRRACALLVVYPMLPLLVELGEWCRAVDSQHKRATRPVPRHQLAQGSLQAGHGLSLVGSSADGMVEQRVHVDVDVVRRGGRVDEAVGAVRAKVVRQARNAHVARPSSAATTAFGFNSA
jgi:hypothetical protein